MNRALLQDLALIAWADADDLRAARCDVREAERLTVVGNRLSYRAHCLPSGEVYVTCPDCGGEGVQMVSVHDDAERPCDRCDGVGELEPEVVEAIQIPIWADGYNEGQVLAAMVERLAHDPSDADDRLKDWMHLRGRDPRWVTEMLARAAALVAREAAE